MRPRVFPAEDPGNLVNYGRSVTRFNEAAGIPRGRPGMRMRANRDSRCFNEAAGIPRGRLVSAADAIAVLASLQ